jgi:uncharacterized protein (TIGR02246 family)
MEGPAIRELERTFSALSEAWKRGDGEAFAQWCTGDVDFINLLGIHVKGRPAVVAMHEKIFQGPYRGSTVAFTIESVRAIAPEMVLAIVPSRIDVPTGPVQGIVLSVASVLLVREGDRWKVASFHNTRREATQKNHLSIMRAAVEG